MKQSHLNLNHYQLLDVSIKPETGYTKSSDALYPDVSKAELNAEVAVIVRSKDTKDPKDFALRLKIALKPKEKDKYPYNIEISIEGFFTVLHDLPRPDFDREKFVLVNGASILFGVLREMLMTMTAHFQNGSIMLPTVSFLDLLKEKELEPTKA